MATTTSLLPDQVDLLTKIGRSTYQNIMGVVVESSVWGCYALLFMFSVYIQLSSGIKSSYTQVMLGVTCLLFATSTILLALNVTWAEVTVKGILLDNNSQFLDERIQDTDAKLTASFAMPMEALFLLNMIIGDAVVIWRAYVIWNRRKAVIFVPIFCLIVALAFAISDVVCLQASELDQTTIPIGSRICTWSEPTAWALSLLTNVISTSLIAIQAWKMRCYLMSSLEQTPSNKKARRAFFLIIESGCIYCLFWMSQIILFFDIPRTSKAFYAYQFFASIGDQISGIYPTAIIVIVSLRQTFSDQVTEASVTMTPRLATFNQSQSQVVFVHPLGGTMTNVSRGSVNEIGGEVKSNPKVHTMDTTNEEV